MPNFLYMARDQQGIVQSGHLDAIDEDEVVRMLQHRGLLVTAVARKEQESFRRAPIRGTYARRMHARVRTDDQVLLCQQLSTLVEAGIPLLRALEVASAQVESRMLLLALEEIRRDVSAGKTFRDALSKHSRIFGSLWLNLVETGEASGHLAQSLQQLARHYESAQHLQNEAKTALTYPACLVVAGIAVLAVFVYWVIPKFTGIFSMFNVELPPITLFMIWLSHMAQKYFVTILLVTSIGGYALWRYLGTRPGRWMRDRVILRLPLFGRFFSHIQLAEFSRGLSTLLESGVPLLSGLEILENSATNMVYGQAIGGIREHVKEGKTMAEPMQHSGLFPPLTVQMVQVGEEVGELGKMVSRIAKYYEDRVEIFIARMTRLFEPIAIVAMGILVAIIVMSIFMPIFKLAGGAGAN